MIPSTLPSDESVHLGPKRRFSASVSWAALGALFGCAFPMIAVLLRLIQVGWAGARYAVGHDPLLWIIFTAPVFLGAFAWMGGRQQDKVRALAEGLEELVEARTKKLADAVNRINEAAQERAGLLAGLPAGVASFDMNGWLSGERSPAFNRLIPHGAASETVDELLAPCGAEVSTTATVRLLLWDDEGFVSPFDDTVGMLPRRWTTEVDGEPRHLNFHYRPIRSTAGGLARVLIVVEDDTALSEARTEQARTKERIDRLSTAATDLEAYAGFVEEVTERLSAVQEMRKSGDVPTSELLREIHTLKGTFGLFAFHGPAAICHALENAYGDRAPVAALWADLAQTWRRESQDVAQTLGIESVRMIPVEPDRLARLQRALGQPDLRKAQDIVLGLRCHPLARVLGRYERYLRARAQRHGKQVEFEVLRGSDEVAYHEAQRVDGALTHLFNNVIAHAARKGKPLTVKVGATRRDDGGLRWFVEDNGRGIDPDQLARRAVELGLRSSEWLNQADTEDKLETVFLSGCTSQRHADDIAGRGMGLGAARSDVRALGGDIKVMSTIGSGTSIEIWVPGQASMDVMPWSDTPPVEATT